jgi:hypothetical protein
MKKLLWLLLGSALFGSTQNVLADSNRSALQNFVRPAVVKINAIFRESKLPPGECDAEGTGFIVGSWHIVTAAHVIDSIEDCGRPLIVAKSYYYDTEWIMEVKDRKGDVALLVAADGVQLDLSRIKDHVRPCAVAVNPNDVYDVTQGEATRYGIPRGRYESIPRAVDVGSKNNEFKPLVQITSTEFYEGESGGPILYGALVIGMIREKLRDAQTIGLMTPATQLNDILVANGVEYKDGEECSIIPSSRRFAVKTTVLLESGGVGGSFYSLSGSIKADESQEITAGVRKALTESFDTAVSQVRLPVSNSILNSDKNGVNFEIRIPFPADHNAVVGLNGQLEYSIKNELDKNLDKFIQESYERPKS